MDDYNIHGVPAGEMNCFWCLMVLYAPVTCCPYCGHEYEEDIDLLESMNNVLDNGEIYLEIKKQVDNAVRYIPPVTMPRLDSSVPFWREDWWTNTPMGINS